MEETIGKRIFKNRKRLGLTQDALAEKLGVTAQAVSKWENDQSCPDITMLPRLTQVLGISADSLLGLAPPAKAAELVTADSSSVHIDGNDNHWEFRWDAGRKNHMGMAIWIISTAIMMLAGNYVEHPVDLWVCLWSTGLTVFGVFGLWPKFSFLRLGCALAGGYFIAGELFPRLFVLEKSYILPLLLLLFGLSLLRKAGKKHLGPIVSIASQEKEGRQWQYRAEGESFSCDVSFGSHTQPVELPCLSHGEAEVNFGELTLDLRSCEAFREDCYLDLECNFGNIILLLPASLRAVPASDSFVGHVRTTGQPAPDARTIRLNCQINFGEIQLCYN